MLRKKLSEHEESGIKTKDLRFFHVDSLLNYAGHCEKLSSKCKLCKSYQKEIETIVNDLDQYLNGNMSGRSAYEKKLHAIQAHLKSEHLLVVPKYNLSLFTFIGMIIGTLFGIVVAEWINPNSRDIFLLVGWFIGLLAGRLSGLSKEKKLEAQGRYL